MCLTICNELTEKFKKDNSHRKFVRVKKLVFINQTNQIFTPHQYNLINGGWLVANKDNIKGSLIKKNEYENCYPDYKVMYQIHDGVIHCYNTNKNNYIKFDDEEYINSFALVEDFVAAGERNDLAFHKIYIPKVELNKLVPDYAK